MTRLGRSLLLGCVAWLTWAAAGPAWAQSVSLSGRMGSKALLVIDGQTRMLAVGQTSDGVRLLSLDDQGAQLEWAGKRHTLALGGAPVSLGARDAGGGKGQRIVLTSSSGGHFQALGSIRGQAVTFLVDTGATSVAMSAAQADRLGLTYRRGSPGRVETANGSATAWRVTLDRLRIGDVELSGVEGVVIESNMPVVLLGNSFLSRFEMQSSNDQLVLTRRY